LLFVADHKIEP